MKWILLLGVSLLATGCCCNNAVVEYRSVAVAPVIETVDFTYREPIDVTTTMIDFY